MVAPAPAKGDQQAMKIEGVYNIKGRGAALACTPDGAPRMGSIIRSHVSRKAWLIKAVERFCVPWAPGMRCGLTLQAREDGAMPVEGEEVEMIEPLDLLARLDALEAVVHRHHHACLGVCGCSVCDWYVASRKASK